MKKKCLNCVVAQLMTQKHHFIPLGNCLVNTTLEKDLDTLRKKMILCLLNLKIRATVVVTLRVAFLLAMPSFIDLDTNIGDSGIFKDILSAFYRFIFNECKSKLMKTFSTYPCFLVITQETFITSFNNKLDKKTQS